MQAQAACVVGECQGCVVESFLQTTGLSLSALHFCAAQPADSQFPTRYHTVLLSTSSSQLPTALASLSKRLLPGAALYVHEQDASKGAQAIQRDLLLSGYVDDQPVASFPSHLGLLVRAKRPDYEVGAKAPLKLKRPVPAPAAAPAPSTWQINNQDEDEEMLDDDEFLTEEDRAKPDVPAAGDCSTSRKACKNCSCGRAEKEAAGERVKLTQEMLDNPQSSCGSCTLGDAFRCAGCPYRGLPAFEAGKKIQLGSDFLTADA